MTAVSMFISLIAQLMCIWREKTAMAQWDAAARVFLQSQMVTSGRRLIAAIADIVGVFISRDDIRINVKQYCCCPFCLSAKNR
jgi:hypothetical protein